MKYDKVIFSCIQYIENNITEKLTAECIAHEMGYSVYHFLRIFKEQTGISLMEYVKDRKLFSAASEIVYGRKIIDIAVEYGYETHSGFTKAFRKKYGFSPAFLHAICIQKIFDGGNYDMSNDKVYEKAGIFLKGTENYKRPEELYGFLIESIEKNKLFDDFTIIKKAYDMACTAHKSEKRKSGEEYVTHCINTAIILAEMEADEDTIIAGLLHEVIEKKTNVTLKEIEDSFSKVVSELVSTVTNFNEEYEKTKDINSFDERVIMIKLADRLHNMRTIEFMDKKIQAEKAKETIAVFSPIAAKLNNSKLKEELDTLALKYV